MPDFVPVGGSIEFRITGQHSGGKKMYNIGHVDCGSPFPTLAEVTEVANIVAAWCTGIYKSVFNQAILINEVRARSNAAEPGPTYTNNTVNQAGALVGDQSSMDTTCCVNLLSGLTGQSNRGKFYIFLPDEGVMTNGLFSSAYAAGCEVVLSSLAADLATGGFALAVESRATLSLKQVSAYLAQPIPSHLRSRKVNRGI